jgi:hypothetical protein
MKDAVVFFSVVFVGLLLWLAFNREQPSRFRRKAILTGIDVEFFARLRSSLGDCIVTPNVAVSSLIEPAGSMAARRHAQRRIAGRRVGYAVFDEELRLLAVVELAQRSRPTRSEAERDGFFAALGVKTIRFSAKRLPSEAKIRMAVFNAERGEQRSRAAPGADGEAFDYRPQHTPWRNTLNAHI